jgi:hypothetical protein
MDGSRLSRFRDLFAPALLVVLPLCLFGPHTIYSGNEAEFTAPFWVLVRPLLGGGAGLVLGLVGFGLVLSTRTFRAYVAVLFGVGIVLWIQGSFLVADYGAFNGEAIDWTTQSWRNPYEITLWVAVPLLAVAAARYIFPMAAFASGALVALQALLLLTSAAQADPGTRAEWKGPADSMFDLSRTKNAIHLVLDGFQSELFHEILDEDRQALDQSWSGSVFFADHSGAFPSTMVSIPAMLTGTVYRNERDLQKYVRDQFDKGSLFKSLRAGGYRVDSVAEMQYDFRSATNFHRTSRPYVSYPEYVQFAGWQLADLSLFRHAPHVLRPKIHNGDEWRLQALFGPGDTRNRRHHPVNGAAVLAELAGRARLAIDEPLYKYVHVGIPHLPLAVDAECNFTGIARVSRERYKAQARCAVRRVSALLDRLRDLEVYDSSLVVVSSDHGLGFTPRNFINDRQLPAGALSTLAARSMALLVVKAPGARGPVRVSSAPTTITDIPATVLDALGVAHALSGEPALKLAENAVRSRVFAMYDWEHENWSQHYFEFLDLMEINGRALDGSNWTLKTSIYAPDAGADARSRGLYDTHRSRTGIAYRWSPARAFFHAPVNAPGFSLQVRSIAPTPQTVTLSVGDRELSRVTLGDQSWVTLKQALPPAANADVLWVELRVDPTWRPRGETRQLGVQTRELNWIR